MSFTRPRPRPFEEGSVALAAVRVDLDTMVICGSGDLAGLAGAAGDVRGVETAEVVAKQLRLVARHGSGVLSRLMELADLCDVNVEMIVVFPLRS